MAVVIDPSQGGIAQGLAGIGQGLASRIFERENREKSLMANPATLQSLLPSARAAQRAGPEALKAFEEGLGVREGFVESSILTLAPTLGQAQEEALMNVGAPQLMADGMVARTLFETGSFESLVDMNIPMLEALGAGQRIRTGIAEGRYQAQYYDILSENDGASSRVRAELAQANALAAQSGLEVERVENYMNAINSIDQSSEEGRKAALLGAISLTDPNFARILSEEDDRAFRLRLAQLQNQPDPVDRARFTLDFLTKIEEAATQLQGAEDEGVDEDVLDMYRALLGNMTNMYQTLESQGLVEGADLPVGQAGRGLFGGRKGKKNEFTIDGVIPGSVRNIQSAIDSGAASIEEFESLLSNPEFLPSSREREVFAALVAHQQAQDEIEITPLESLQAKVEADLLVAVSDSSMTVEQRAARISHLTNLQQELQSAGELQLVIGPAGANPNGN